MPDTASRRAPAARRSVPQAWLIALVVVMVSAGISALSSSTKPDRAAARPASVAGAHGAGGDAAQAVAPGGATTTVGDGGAATATGAAPTAGATPTVPAVHTMSMDDPIQGGLTAHQEQAISARLVGSHREPASASGAQYWTPQAGQTAVARAASWIGMPYSWAGGSTTGPTPGVCVPGDGGDLDCHVVGFDCSGLMMYAWGPYVALPHLAAAQRGAGGFHPSITQLMPGDMVFFSGYLPGGTGHVAIYAGDGNVIEAPQSGETVRWAKLADLIAEDGTYRGATRPLTDPTPKLTALAHPVPLTGATITLHGAHLDAVDAVHLTDSKGTVDVVDFVSKTDDAIVLAVPAHKAGTLQVTVSTPWQADSTPVGLTYAKPVPQTVAPAPPRTTPTRPTSPAPPSSPTPPSTPPSSPTRPVPPTSPAPPTKSDPPTTPPPSSDAASSPSPSASPSAPAAGS